MKYTLAAIMFGAIAIIAVPRAAAAQQSEDQSPAARALNGDSGPGNVGAPNGASGAFGHHGHADPQGSDSGPTDMPALKPVTIPRQRLDTGALFCHTEAQLKQHQAAIMARLAGRDAPEPGGCHIIGDTTPVSIVAQDGQAVTEVQTAGDTPARGWTDAVIRDSDPMHSPMH
jgi:hypothetical protein